MKTPRKASAPPKRKTAATKPAAPTPGDHGGYVAGHYHEIETDAGVIRVEPGHIVVTDGDRIHAMPPQRFSEAFPNRADPTKFEA